MSSAKHALFSSSGFWVLLGFIAFACLPSVALDYGLLESTGDEFYAAMGWSSWGISLWWFLPLLVFLITPKLGLSTQRQAKLDLAFIVAIGLFTFISAMLLHISLGYAVIIQIVSLSAIATLALAKLKVMQGDKFIIAALISIVLLIFFFIVYPTIAILISMFYDGDTFAPEQVLRILNQNYIVRVITNSLFLSAFVFNNFRPCFCIIHNQNCAPNRLYRENFLNFTYRHPAVCCRSWGNAHARSLRLRNRIFRYLFRF